MFHLRTVAMDTSRTRQPLEEAYCRELLRQARERCQAVRNAPLTCLSAADFERIHEHPGRYDPQRWFEIFSRLRMADGYVLDFVYNFTGNSGGPRLYARREVAPRVGSIKNLQDKPDAWQALVEGDLTPEGIFERVVLARVAHRFHRHWHAYADSAEFVCDRELLQRDLKGCPEPGPRMSPPGALPMPRAQVLALAEPDLVPSAEIVNGTGVLLILSWQLPGGLSRHWYEVRAGQPVRKVGDYVLCAVTGGPRY
jgi:hypothetical protein